MKLIDKTKQNINGINVKFFFRHSIRPSLKGIEKPLNIGLTEDGVKKAHELGKSLSWPIGEASSSISQRCIQTVEEILNGANSRQVINHATHILTSPAITDEQLAKQTICAENNFKKVIYKLSLGENLPGFSPIHATGELLLDYIFSTGNKCNSIDLYCTHDANIVMLLTHLMPSINSQEAIYENWPNPLEGLFLWGDRNDFSFLWKGATFHYQYH